jgi:hypothetical protein
VQGRILKLFLHQPDFVLDYHGTGVPDYFQLETHRLICSLLIRWLEKYRQRPDFDLFTTKVMDRSKRMGWTVEQQAKLRETLTELMEDDLEKKDAQVLKDEVINFARASAMELALIRGIDQVRSSPDNIDGIRGYVRNALEVGRNGRRELGVDFFGQVDDIESILSASARYMSQNVVGTLWPTIDRHLIGGIGEGEVGVLMAPTNRGKSTFLVSLGYAALYSGRNVVHITLEMKEHAVSLRYAARIAKISQNEILKGTESPHFEHVREELRKFKERTGTHLQVKYFTPGTCSIADIGDYLDRLYDLRGFKPGLLIIDYMDELGKEFETELYVSGGKAMQEMIALGDDWRFPTWTASQTQRGARAKRTVNLEDVAESWQKVNKAHVVITINQTEEEEAEQLMRLFGAKVREGTAKWTVPVRADMARCMIKEIPQEQTYHSGEVTVLAPDQEPQQGAIPPAHGSSSGAVQQS